MSKKSVACGPETIPLSAIPMSAVTVTVQGPVDSRGQPSPEIIPGTAVERLLGVYAQHLPHGWQDDLVNPARICSDLHDFRGLLIAVAESDDPTRDDLAALGQYLGFLLARFEMALKPNLEHTAQITWPASAAAKAAR
jgi:hypothetical protein